MSTRIRIYELAAELGVEAGALADWIGDEGIADVQSHASTLSEDEAAAVRAHARFAAEADAEDGSEGAAATEPPARSDEPASHDEAGAEDGGTDEPGPAASSEAAASRYRLTGKGSVRAGSVRVEQGEVIGGDVLAALPERVRGWFQDV